MLKGKLPVWLQTELTIYIYMYAHTHTHTQKHVYYFLLKSVCLSNIVINVIWSVLETF